MALPKVVEELLRVAAPTLAAGLAGPFAGIAASVVTAALNEFLGPPATPVAAVPGLPPGTAQPPSAGGATPPEVIEAIRRNSDDTRLMIALQKAEKDLQVYEKGLGFKFAELVVKDRERAGDFQAATSLAHPLFKAGMIMISMSLFIMLVTIAGCLSLLFGLAKLPPGTSAELAAAVFGLIGQTIGFINGISGVIVAFYWGVSQGDHSNTNRIADTMQDLARASVVQASRAPALPLPAGGPDDADAVAQPVSADPAVPAPSGLVAEILPQLAAPHRHFADGVSWALSMDGIEVDGAPAQGTPGEPATVRMIWKRYGDAASSAAKRYGVPIELIIATIATESRGDPNARREEPSINDRSIGLMQTLVTTARSALGRRDMREDELLDPATSILAGTAYIAQQRATTHFDPPLVAAAYNAGSLRREDAEGNRWRLVCYPKGTGRHIDNFAAWFADAMKTSAQDGWGKGTGIPSFASCLAASISAKGRPVA